jgi:transcriptional regulator with XRE-family HTH domain
MESKFAERFKFIRLQRGLTLENIAIGINASKSTLSQYENGKRKPELGMIIKISEYLGISADYLLGLIEETDGQLKQKKAIPYHQLSGTLREFFSNGNTTQDEKDKILKELTNIYWKYKK